MNDVLQLITVFIIFVFVLFVTFFTVKWISNFQKNSASGSNIELIESLRLSNNKLIQIVKIGKDYIAIAVCKDSVTVLNKMSEEDLSLIKELPEKNGESFQNIFNKFKKKNK